MLDMVLEFNLSDDVAEQIVANACEQVKVLLKEIRKVCKQQNKKFLPLIF